MRPLIWAYPEPALFPLFICPFSQGLIEGTSAGSTAETLLFPPRDSPRERTSAKFATLDSARIGITIASPNNRHHEPQSFGF